MFTVYHSNQLDVLTALTAALIEREPLEDPFQRELILVQSPGMAQWLQIKLADHFGIAANLHFPLPATFIWDMFTRILPGIPKESAFSKDAMTWKLMWLLPQLLPQEAFAPLRHYLHDDEDQRKIYQLAARVADLFDQYLVYRPQWLAAWEAGREIDGLSEAQSWQAPLWSALVNYTHELQQPEWHRANLYARFIEALDKSPTPPKGLPQRVFICGISALPPVYLQALRALGKHIDIHLMFTNPCRYYWGDIQSYTYLAKLQSRRRREYYQHIEQSLFRHPERAGELFSPEGEQQLTNPLLASWGQLGRDHLYQLAQIDELQEVNAFVEMPTDNLLHTIQRDMLELEDHAVIGTAAEQQLNSQTKRQLDPDDRSISFHACHSPQREVEILHDHLLNLLEKDPTLSPRDIIVMVADIDSYVPYIQAVFGNAPHDRYLPFAVSDRKASHAHPILQAFITLLHLPQSRFTAEQVLALLDIPALASRFGIDEEGLTLLRLWVNESGVRWGLDDENVEEMSLPATGQHTWHFGLTRMLLGYAMESECGQWQGVLPYDESSGLAAIWIGQLADLLSQLSYWRRLLQQSRSLEAWTPLCRQLLESFFTVDNETEAVLVLIEQQWLRVIAQGINAQYPQDVSLCLLRDEMSARLDNERISQRFLAGPINFCTLMPMRSIPFRVVCLLGMNDGIYPRTLPPLGFDLMAFQHEKGDRSRRDDDRYLYLEAILSAQEHLYISYIGNSIQDNSERYPSVLLSELAEYIAQSYCLPGDEKQDTDLSAQRVMNHLIVRHPRMPFAVENFIPGDLYQSYAAEWLPAAARQGTPYLAFDQPLEPWYPTEIALDDLIRFYRHPIKAFFQQRLGVYFSHEETELNDEEPFTLDTLSRYQLNSHLLSVLIAEESPQLLQQRYRAAGHLPYGAFGELYWQDQVSDMSQLASVVRQEYQLDSLEQALELDTACHLTLHDRNAINHGNDSERTVKQIAVKGWLNQVQSDGLVRWRPGVLNAVDGMQLWIESVVYSLCRQTDTPHQCRMFGRQESEWRFATLSPEQAQAELDHLINGYVSGMNRPLPLLPKSGWAWLMSVYDPQTDQLMQDDATLAQAHDKFMAVWQDGYMTLGEGSDLYVQRAINLSDEFVWEQVTAACSAFLLPLMRNSLVSSPKIKATR